MELFQDVLPFVGATNHSYVSSLALFAIPNRAKYTFSKIGVVAKDKKVQDDLIQYFEDYVFPISTNSKLNFTNWTVDAFETQEEFFKVYGKDAKTPYCCGLTFNDFDTETDTYDIEFHFSKLTVPDTNLLEYNPLVRLPDLKSWDLWF